MAPLRIPIRNTTTGLLTSCDSSISFQAIPHHHHFDPGAHCYLYAPRLQVKLFGQNSTTGLIHRFAFLIDEQAP
jgi:hypothetical protein